MMRLLGWFTRLYDRLFWGLLIRRAKYKRWRQYDDLPHAMVSTLQRFERVCDLLEGLEWHCKIERRSDGSLDYSGVHFVPKVGMRTGSGQIVIDKIGLTRSMGESDADRRQRQKMGLYCSRDFDASGQLKGYDWGPYVEDEAGGEQLLN